MLIPAPRGLKCPKCGVRISKIAPSYEQEVEMVDGALLFCLDCASPVQYLNNEVRLLSPGEILERLLSPIGESYQRMWSEVQTAVKVGRQAAGL